MNKPDHPSTDTSPRASGTTGSPGETRTAGKGVPDKTPQTDRTVPGQQSTPRDASAEASLQMPHERDQSTDMTPGKPSAEVQQAGKDVKKGLQDTSKHPEMDTAYKKQK
ncbi:MAG: hypothetical protein Q7T87_06865 [Polaromonas sp.]|nr:hypothetical protein [Polaromonas sp.]